MPSLQSQLINFTLRNRHLLSLRLKRETWDWSTSIPAFREACEKGARKAKLPAGIEISPAAIDSLPAGLKAEWIRLSATSQKATDDPVIFYTHGGGYVSGSCSDHRGFVAKFVPAAGLAVFRVGD
jgi:epsilon-lactone hydrolase